MRIAAAALLLLLAPLPQDREPCVQAGLGWLLRHQCADGHWSDSDFVKQCLKEDGGPCGAKGEAIGDVGCTAMALMAFHGATYTHLSKDSLADVTVGPELRKSWEWLLKQQGADGSFGSPKGGHFIEEHAMATAALTEAVGMTDSKIFKDPAAKAVTFLLSARTKEKGWAARAREGDLDAAATGWALAALQGARRAEIEKADTAMKDALAALKGDGKRKVLDRTLHLALDLAINEPKGDEAKARVAALIKELKGNNALRFDPLLSFAMTVARRRGDAGWKDERKALGDTIRGSQNAAGKVDKCLEGSWNPTPQSPVAYGRVMASAYHVLTAQAIFGYGNILCTPD